MTQERFADRLDPATYADEEPVRLWLVEGTPADELYLPEALWHRLRMVAAAYHLHLLPILDGLSDPVFLSASQCGALVDETDFVAARVDDALLMEVISAVRQLATRARGASKNALGIEFP